MQRTRRYLVIILIAATVITALSSLVSYRNSTDAAADSLRFQALGVAASLEASLKASDLFRARSHPPGENIFRDIIADGTWEGIAYISLYDAAGLVLLHSNENLIGRRVDDAHIKKALAGGMPVYGSVTLGTDERVFVSNFPLHLHDNAVVLRIALHTYPVERVMRQARLQLLSVAFVIAILWIIGFFFMKAVRRSGELKAAMAEKERLAVLGEMASVLAHEIRNPLGSIKGFAQYAREQDNGDKAQKAECLDIIVAESKRLESLTEDLLAYARPAEVKLQAFGLGELVAEVVQSLEQRGAASRADIECSIPTGMGLITDRDKLKQVLINILQNSLDALDSGGRVEIEAEASGSATVIMVKDSGCGMDAETVEKAFAPFFTTKARGTGLGLAIVDKLVKAVGGTISVASEAGKGTVFRIGIPRGLSLFTKQ